MKTNKLIIRILIYLLEKESMRSELSHEKYPDDALTVDDLAFEEVAIKKLEKLINH